MVVIRFIFIITCLFLGSFTFEKLSIYGDIGKTYYLIVYSDILPIFEFDGYSFSNEKITNNSYYYSFPVELKT